MSYIIKINYSKSGGEIIVSGKRGMGAAAKLLIVMFSIYAAVKLVSQRIEINKRIEANQELEQQLNQQINTNNEIAERIENSDNAEFYEQIARNKLGYVKPGERVFIDISNM